MKKFRFYTFWFIVGANIKKFRFYNFWFIVHKVVCFVYCSKGIEFPIDLL